MREEDGEDRHPASVARKVQAKQRLIGSSLLGVVGMAMMLIGDNVYLGFAAAGLAFGIISVSDLKELRK